MKTLFTTTAIVSALTIGPVLAQSSDMSVFRSEGEATDVHASEFIGMTVYAADPDRTETWPMDEVAELDHDWENVGEINDLLLTRDGDVSAVLVDIGGFLGIGERQVAMSMDQVRFVSDGTTEDADDFFLVIPASVADLEEAPEYDTGWQTGRMLDTESDGEGDETEMAGTVGTEINPVDENMRAGHRLAAEDVATLTTEDLTGARVYDANGAWIGEIHQLNLDAGGSIETAIIDVGGFLGIGEKPVALNIEELDISRMEDAVGLHVSVGMTEEELEQLPTWDG